MHPTHLDLFSGIGGFALAGQSREATARKSDSAQRSRNGDLHDSDSRCELLEGWQTKPAEGPAQWPIEPAVGRVAHGISRRMDRLKGLGNSIVPQVAYQILKEIRKLI